MKKIYQYILLAVAMVATASCSNELDDTLHPVENGTLQFVVGDFPAFGEEPQTRASSFGTPDAGKTEWETNDEITVIFTSDYYGEQTATLTYGEDGTWASSGTLSYLENERPTVMAVYTSSDTPGLGEYLITTDCTLADNALSINFEDATRTYSRLRIVTLADLFLTVTTTGFTPAGAEEAGEYFYTLTADKKGNAYLYGIFAEGATVSVKQGDVTLKDYTFTAEKNPNGTGAGKSYALQAGLIIDGTFGGKAEATDDEVAALTETIKEYVKSGCSAIFVTGSEMATHYYGFYNYPAYANALYNVTGAVTNTEFNGKVDLILPDATKLVEYEFDSHYCLKSITLPKVTTIGDAAFFSCINVETLTFGSVITSLSEHAFPFLGEMNGQGGKTHLVLNCGQMQTEGYHKPNLETNEWGYDGDWEKAFKWESITLTHTGACDECKAAEQ